MNINIGELSKPATVLIEKISDAIGGIAKPNQIRRIAKAEADAEIIKAEAQIKISEMQRRALERMIYEEGKKQENIENITAKAISNLSPDAQPENIEKDWLTLFFEQSRLTSDDEMQLLWGHILSGEANAPGSFSKRTILSVASLDKKDALLFTKLCTFCWMINGLSILILDPSNPIYNYNDINFETLTHLHNIGLINFENFSGFQLQKIPKFYRISYYDKEILIEFPSNENNLNVGKVLLTQTGKELALICKSSPSFDYFNHVIETWFHANYILSSPVNFKS